MERSLSIAALCAVSALAGTAAPHQDQANFARIWKVGDSAAYGFTHSIEAFKTTFTSDVTVTATKILPDGRPELKFHMSNMANKVPSGTTDSTKSPEDKLVQFDGMNMPKLYHASLGTAEHAFVLLVCAASTMDHNVKAGDEKPWSIAVDMGGKGTMTLTGTIKVLEISTANKRLKAQITSKILADGQNAGTYTNLSTFSLPDCSLIESVGDFHVGTKQEVKFAAKK